MADVILLRRRPRESARSSLGMVLFLASWALSFVGLFIAFAWVRARSPHWPPPGAPLKPVVLPNAASLAVVLSSASAQTLVGAVREARRRTARIALIVTLVLGLLFLVLQAVTWTQLWSEGLRLHRRADDAPWDIGVVYAGCFYALTGFHAAHVLSGLGVLGSLAPAVWYWRVTPSDHQPVRLAVWFWHFVTLAWIGVWWAAYLL